MKQDAYTTEVQFRKFTGKFQDFKEGDLIAVFPYEIYNQFGGVMSYQHIGQHGECDPFINEVTTPAKQSEYAELLRELENLGYNLKVIRRRSHAKYLKAFYQLKKLSA
jgi:hypothetical protein